MRLLVHVEGQTEETFVNEVLAPHLYTKGYHSVSARLLGNARQRQSRGGIRGWDSVQKDIARHLLEDPGARATMMVDYYGLPASGPGAWPGRSSASFGTPTVRAGLVERAILSDIQAAVGTGFRQGSFIPYVVMHEFEGLLFSDCERFSAGIGMPSLAMQLQAIRNTFASPEDINDSPQTAPSKRLASLIPSYQKPFQGVLAALEIGLGSIRLECPHFDAWLTTLERSWP